MAHPNEEAPQRGYEAFGRGDTETVMGLLPTTVNGTYRATIWCPAITRVSSGWAGSSAN